MSALPEPPGPVELPRFKFTALRQIRLGDEALPDSMGLLAFSNKGGLLLAGVGKVLHVIKSKDIEAQDECTKNERSTENQNFPTVKVSLPGRVLHVGISCDSLVVSVVVDLPIFPILYLFDTRGLLENDKPFAEVCLNTTVSGVGVSQVCWNPALNDIFSVTFLDGSIALYTLKADGSVDCQTLPPAVGIVSVSWSPKGKQMAAVRKDGSVTQYKPDLKEAKTTPGPNLSGYIPVSIFWISTYEFLVGYQDSNDPGSRPGLWLIKGSKAGTTEYSFFDDICYSSGEERLKRFDCLLVPEWNYIVVSSGNSVELALLTLEQEAWRQGILEDCGRAEIPLFKTNEERYPAGMVFNPTAERETPVGENLEPPAPLLHILSSDGQLCSFSCVNSSPGAQDLCAPAAELSQEGRRRGTVQFPTMTVKIVDQAPPAYAEAKSETKKAVEFGSGIFNTNSFIQSTPIKPFGSESKESNKENTSSASQAASAAPAFSGSSWPGGGSTAFSSGSTGFGGGSTGFGGGSMGFRGSPALGGASGSFFGGISKPKENVPSPLAVGKSVGPEPTQTTPIVKDPTPPLKEKNKKSSPPPVFQPSLSADETGKKKIHEKIDHEYLAFELKLAALRESVAAFSVDIGTQEEKTNLVTRTEALKRFSKEVLDTTDCQSREIKDLKAQVVETTLWLNEARSRNMQSSAHSYSGIMRSRPLDPRSSRKMDEVQRTYSYLEVQLDEANTKLDVEWEEAKGRSNQTLGAVNQADLFAALLTNHKIVEAQKTRVDRLLQEAAKVKLAKTILTPGYKSAGKPRQESGAEAEIRRLADSFRDKSRLGSAPTTPRTPTSSVRPASLIKSPVELLSPAKDAALRKLLENRKCVSVVRQVKPASPAGCRLGQSPDQVSSSVLLHQLRAAEQKSAEIQRAAEVRAAEELRKAAERAKVVEAQEAAKKQKVAEMQKAAEQNKLAGVEVLKTNSIQKSLFDIPSPGLGVKKADFSLNTSFDIKPLSTESPLSAILAKPALAPSSVLSPVLSSTVFSQPAQGAEKPNQIIPEGDGEKADTSTKPSLFSFALEAQPSTFSFTPEPSSKSAVSQPGGGVKQSPTVSVVKPTPSAESKERSTVISVTPSSSSSASSSSSVPSSSNSAQGASISSLPKSSSATATSVSAAQNSAGMPSGATATSAAQASSSSIFGGSAPSRSTASTLSTPTASSGSGSSIFSAQPSSSGSSIFGGAKPSTSETPGGEKSKSLFGGSSGGASIFGGGTPTSSVSTSTEVTSSSSIFGGEANSGGFNATSATSGSLFGGSTTITFGSAQVSTEVKPSSIFGAATTAASSNGSFFGGNKTAPSTTGTAPAASAIFGGASANTGSFFGGSSTNSSGSIFGGGTKTQFGSSSEASKPISSSSGSIFGAAASSTSSLFGGVSNSGPTSASPFGGTPSGGGLFGGSKQASGGSIFGGAASSTPFGGTAPSTGATFGSASSTFGGVTAPSMSTSVFGNETTSSSTPFGGGTAPSTGTSVFGGGTTSTPFGGGASTSGSLFGGGSSGGFLSGLGGSSATSTSPNKNPFGATSFSGAGSSGGLFGASTSSTFGGGTSSSSSRFGSSGPFSGGGSSIGSQGFGVQENTPSKPSSGFGGAPAFGSTQAFGATPAFGATSAFGSTPFGASSTFGAAAPSASPFGAGKIESAPTFGSLSGNASGGASFGVMASATPAFGSQPFGGYGSGATGSPPPQGSQFNSWR